MTAVDDAIGELRAQEGTVAGPGLAVDDLEQLERRLGVRLPDAHRTLLLASNGIAVADGHFRVYGSAPDAVTDIVWWNAEDTWRFAWPDRDLGEYLFFGGDHSGAQLAYRREDLRSADGSRRPDPPLIFFDGFRMRPTPLRQRRTEPPFRFADWLTLTLKDARLHPDPPEEWRRFPRIPPTHLLVHVPPIVVAGEDPDNLVLLPAAAAMIANGDVATQWYRMAPEQQVTGFRAYTDDRGRPRMRLEVQ